MSTTPTDQAAVEAALIEHLTDRLMDVFRTTNNHRAFLITVLGVFKGVATAHPCCTRNAAEIAMQVGADLLTQSLKTERPTGGHVH